MFCAHATFVASLVGLVSCVAGCGATLSVGRPPELAHDTLEVSERAADRCIHGTTGTSSVYGSALPEPISDSDLAVALAPISADVRRTAVAAGIEPLLARIIVERERARASGTPSEELLAMRDELAARVYTLETQLLAMEFEVDCVRGLINDRLSEYAESETDRQLSLTIASLVVAAGTGLAAAIWDLANTQTDEPVAEEGPLVIGIAGAVATTGLGTAVLLPTPRPIVYEHRRNVLTPVLRGDDEEHVFPTFVFRLLTLPRAEGAPTPRDELVATWNALVEDGVPSERRELADAILFGEGGVYDPTLLALHQELLEELGATLDGLAREIDLLASTIAELLATELPEESRSE